MRHLSHISLSFHVCSFPSLFLFVFLCLLESFFITVLVFLYLIFHFFLLSFLFLSQLVSVCLSKSKQLTVVNGKLHKESKSILYSFSHFLCTFQKYLPSFNIVFLLVKISLIPKNVILKEILPFFLKKIMLRLQSPPPP